MCQGRTALYWAALKGRTEVAGILIEGGAKADLKNNDVSNVDWVQQR